MGKKVRGQGSVRRRGDTGKYVIDYYDNLGKRHVETIGTNKRQAINRLTERMNQIRTGTYRTPGEGRTFKEFAEKWLAGKVGIKDTTKISYEGILTNHLIPYFGDGRIGDLRRENIKDFIKMKTDEKTLSPKSISNILLVLHQIIDDAQIEDLIVLNPYVKIEKPKIERPEVDYLRTHEIPIFLEATQNHRNLTMHALFFTAIFTGMRRGEFLGLKWGDIDWENKKIHVRRSYYRGSYQTPKSEYSKRAIDLGPRLIQILRDHRTKQNETRLKAGGNWIDNDVVFSDGKGRPLDADNLYHRHFRVILRKAGLRTIRIHDLRHTFASVLIAAGHNIKYIQNQLGHSSVKTTIDLYTHLMPEVYQGAGKKSEDFVFGQHGNVMVTDKEKGLSENR